MNYKWKIINMTVSDDSSETVTGAWWECHGIIDELNLTASGFQTLPRNDDEKFINYANLTENIVIDWVKQSLGAEKIAKIEKNILASYLKRLEVSSKNTLPWE